MTTGATGSINFAAVSRGGQANLVPEMQAAALEKQKILLSENKALTGSISQNIASQLDMDYKLGNSEERIKATRELMAQTEAQINEETFLKTNEISNLKVQRAKIEKTIRDQAMEDANGDEQKAKQIFEARVSTDESIIQTNAKIHTSEADLNKLQSDKLENISRELGVRQRIYDLSKQSYGAQKEFLQSAVDKASLLGGTYNDVAPAIEVANAALVKQREESANIVMESEKTLMTLRQAGLEKSKDYQEAVNARARALADNNKANRELQQNRLVAKDFNKDDLEVNNLRIQQAEQQITLQNNFVVGVRAGVEAQMNLARAIEVQIKAKEEQIKSIEDQISRAGPGRQVELEKELLRLKNDKIGLITKEAEAMKTLRDGWVGAINAMSIGSGRIAKIKIAADENQRMALQYTGQYRSAQSGAVARGNERIGETGFQQFGTRGVGEILGSGGGVGYRGDRGPSDQSWEALRKNAQRIMNNPNAGGVYAAGGAAASGVVSASIGSGGRSSLTSSGGLGSGGSPTSTPTSGMASGMDVGTSALSNLSGALMNATAAIKQFSDAVGRVGNRGI